MSALYATGRLLWRPAILITLFPLALIIALAFWDLPNATLGAANDSAARITLWRFATLVPAMFGLLLSMTMRELQHTLFAWTLPDLSRRLRLGKAVIGAVIAAGIAAAALPFSQPGLSVAVLGWSWLSFAAGGAVFDPVLSKIESRGVALIVAALAFSPLYVQRVMQLQPHVIGMLAAVTGALLMTREFGGVLARKRPLTFTTAVSGTAATRNYWAGQTQRNVEWSTDLSEGGLTSWLRAAHHEGYGGAKAGFLTMKLGQLAITVFTGFISAAPNMVVFFPWIFMDGRRQLLTMLPYPVQRSQRASLFFLSSLLDSLTAAALGLTGLGILLAAGYSFEGTSVGTSTIGLATMLLSFAAWAPVNHWTNVRGPFDKTMTAKAGIKRLALLLVYVTLAMSPGLLFRIFVPPGGAAWIGLAGFAVITHAAYWFALRRHFARADLVVPR
ncbi:MAG TPA: hypothetical protein VMY38_06820 [Gemmatimonadaceae bacterium]|nr:hypothetical protein [Gemmatimonadaceae bacterium]